MVAAKIESTDLLTVREVASILRCSAYRVRVLYWSGALPVTRMSRPGLKRPAVRIPRDGLLSYLAARTTGGEG